MVFDNCGYVRNHTVRDLLGGGLLACATGEQLKLNLISAARQQYKICAAADLGLESWTVLAGRICEGEKDAKYIDTFASFDEAMRVAIRDGHTTREYCDIESKSFKFTYDRASKGFVQVTI